MRGHVAFNLIGIPQADGEFSYWIIECNPRWGGSAYYKYLGDILEVDSWCVKVFKTTKTDLNDLSLGNLTFDPQTKKGIVVINWGTILLGELQIFMAGEKADWLVIEQELGALL